MDLSNLKPAKGAVKSGKRIGRGQGSGRGGTSTRGHKGAQSRSGYSRKWGFEGGQMPIQRRIPRRGFKNINRKEYHTINLDRLEEIVAKHKLKSVDVASLREVKVLPNNMMLKILGGGELKSKIEVTAHAFTASAKEAIEKAGGKVNVIEKVKAVREKAPKKVKATNEEE